MRRPSKKAASKNRAFSALGLPESHLHAERFAATSYSTVTATMEHVETFEEASERSKLMPQRLGADQRVRHVHRRISRCGAGSRCGSILCPTCARTYRIWIASQGVALSQKGVPAHTLVVLIKEVGPDELSGIKLALEKDRLRKDLLRCGFTAAIGNLEVSWKPVRQTWSLHAHLLVFGLVDAQVRRLREMLGKRPHVPGRAGDRLRAIKDPVRQITYLFKFVTYYRFDNKRQVCPLQRPQLAQLADWTRHATFFDFLFCLGFQRRGSIVPNRGFSELLK